MLVYLLLKVEWEITFRIATVGCYASIQLVVLKHIYFMLQYVNLSPKLHGPTKAPI